MLAEISMLSKWQDLLSEQLPPAHSLCNSHSHFFLRRMNNLTSVTDFRGFSKELQFQVVYSCVHRDCYNLNTELKKIIISTVFL